MERIKARCIILGTLLSIMLAGCAFGNDSGADSSDMAGNVGVGSTDAVTRVTSTQELLDAIEPGANIVIADGTYNIPEDLYDIIIDADRDYSALDQSYEYIKFDEENDDLFVISGIDSMTITAEEGCNVELCIYSGHFTSALSFADCSNIEISNITISQSHSEGGIGIRLEGCDNVHIDNVIFDSITNHTVQLTNSKGVELNNCEIRNCSSYLGELFGFVDSEISISNCNFHDNSNRKMFTDANYDYSSFISFSGCTFGPLESQALNYGYVYDFEKISYEKCEFDYSYGIHGANLIDEYYIHSEAEFCQNLGSRRILYLKAGTYNMTGFLSDVMNWQNYVVYGGNNAKDQIKLEGDEGAYTLSLYDMDGLTIIGEVSESGERLVELVNDCESEYVLTFNGCQNITVANIIFKHTENDEDDSLDINWVNCSDVVTEYIAGDDAYSEDGSAEYTIEDIPRYLVISNTEEFIEELKPGVAIKFSKGNLDFRSILEVDYDGDAELFNRSHEYIQFEKCGDGYQPVLNNLSNVYIGCKTDGLAIDRMYEQVSALKIKNCSGIELSDVKINYFDEFMELNCSADALVVEDCTGIFLYHSEIRSPGTGSGIRCIDSDSIILRDCKISESYGDYTLYFENGKDIRIEGCSFVVIGSITLLGMNSVEATLVECDFYTASEETLERVINEDSSNNVVFDGCNFGGHESVLVNYGNVNSGLGYTLTDSCNYWNY